VAALLVVTITVAAVKGISATGNPPVTPLRFFRFFTAQKVREAIGRTLGSDESPGQFGARSLPAAWLQPLRESPGVDVLPFELSYIAQYGLRWRPNFILQNYSAYTARLDREVAENIRAGVRAPDMLLLEFIGLDGRHLLLDTPENFRAILARYQVVGVDYARNLLLVRRSPAIERQPAPFTSTRATFGQWARVPTAKGKLYARMRFKESLTGRLKHVLWQIPAIHLEVEYAGGRTARFRMLAETASNGILLNSLPANLQDLHDLFYNTVYDEVRRFRITGPGASSYRQQFTIDWALDADPAFSNLRASQPAAPELVSWSQAPERLTLTYRDANGYRDLEYIQAIVNEVQDGRHACYLSYEPKRQILMLLNDEGNGFAGVGSIGGPEILKNEKCSVSLTASSVHVERDQVALTLAIRLRSRTPQKLFATAIDGSKLTAPWRLLSKWAR
jgi:hypothetical protein